MNVLAETLKDMEADAQKLYQLIWRQFVACQMTPAQYDSTTLTVAAGDFKLKARGRTLRFDGWTKVMPALRKGDEDPDAAAGQTGRPPEPGGADACAALYQAAGAFQRGLAGKKELEKTRDWPSVDLRVDHFDHSGSRLRAWVENRRFYAEKMGEIVTDRLEENFRDLIELRFYRADGGSPRPGWLNHQSRVERGAEPLLSAILPPSWRRQRKIRKRAACSRTRWCSPASTARPAAVKWGSATASTGVFLGCSGYALPPKERCKTTINLVPENEVLNVLEGDDAETNALRAKTSLPEVWDGDGQLPYRS